MPERTPKIQEKLRFREISKKSLRCPNASPTFRKALLPQISGYIAEMSHYQLKIQKEIRFRENLEELLRCKNARPKSKKKKPSYSGVLKNCWGAKTNPQNSKIASFPRNFKKLAAMPERKAKIKNFSPAIFWKIFWVAGLQAENSEKAQIPWSWEGVVEMLEHTHTKLRKSSAFEKIWKNRWNVRLHAQN